MTDLSKMKALIKELNLANEAYYTEGKEIMSNFDYDKKYDELLALEEKLNMVLSNSPSNNVGSILADYLPKVEHDSKMLSLDKTKEVSTLEDFLVKGDGLLSYKLDGLTVVLTYEDGSLKTAVTRGNGEIGELITNNARYFRNIPLKIKDNSNLIVRGEAVIKYSDFEKINGELEPSEQYKNPRNLCSGTVRALNNEVLKERPVNFYAFSLVNSDKEFKFKSESLKYLSQLGFDVVEYTYVKADTVAGEVQKFKEKIASNDLASDGLVLTYDDIAFSNSLGSTAKFPRDSVAFKWQDELAKTILKEVIFSPSRTGLINPIAVFEPVELEGTTVSRASLHNLSIMEGLKLGIGDEIEVYKANMIIPQVAKNNTCSATVKAVENCPICGEKTKIKDENGVKVLLCPNEYCSAKLVKGFSHFVSRNCMNIEGMSEKTIEKFIEEKFLVDFADIYKLERFKDKIVNMEGFGEKSYKNIIDSVNKSRKVKLPFFINALGIKNIGLSNAKSLALAYDDELEKIMQAKASELEEIDGIGPNMSKELRDYFGKEENTNLISELVSFLDFEKEKRTDSLENLSFVITGSLEHFSNRKELTALIESAGGKVASSVSAKTSYLVNNDIESNSSKNKKAKKLGVSIITEADLLAMLNK